MIVLFFGYNILFDFFWDKGENDFKFYGLEFFFIFRKSVYVFIK